MIKEYKKVIGGKLYDTRKAKLIGVYANLNDDTDTSYYCECLYKKRTGEYFLYGTGGPLTKYAESLGGNLWGLGNIIIPLSYEEAKEFAEKNLMADIYESEFVVLDLESDEKENLYITISRESANMIRNIAGLKGNSVSCTIDNIIFYYYNEHIKK